MRNLSQAESLKLTLGQKPTKVIAVCSGKGGVGKTNIAANIAIALSKRGRDVCLLDADVSLANVDVLLGLQPRLNLSHVISGEADLASTMLRGPNGIRIVPASSGNFSMTDLPVASQAAVIQAFNGLPVQPDVLVVDTAAGISPSVARFVQAAEHALVAVQDEPASLTDAYALIKVFSQNYGISRFNVITNQSTSASAGGRLFEKLSRVTDAYLDVLLRHAGDVPNDRYLVKAVQEQRAVIDAYPTSASGIAFTKIASTLDRLPVQTTPNGGLQFFFERLLGYPGEARGKVA